MITDNFRTLARMHGLTPGAVRHIAKDLGLAVNYSPARHTWYLDEPGRIVRMFNEHLATLAA